VNDGKDITFFSSFLVDPEAFISSLISLGTAITSSDLFLDSIFVLF